jgi:hypothetical protein
VKKPAGIKTWGNTTNQNQATKKEKRMEGSVARQPQDETLLEKFSLLHSRGQEMIVIFHSPASSYSLLLI